MDQLSCNLLAKKIIKENRYLTLATAGETPWAAPLYYQVDNQFKFYFISQTSSLHARHINNQPVVAFAIFDSHQKEGTGNGVQGLGTVDVLGATELKEAFLWYTTSFIEMKPESFLGDAPYQMYRLKAKHFYIQDPSASVDKRVEVILD